jgi:phosphoglycerate kinase
MIKSIYDVVLTDKKVLVRVDFNVPFDDNKNITDDTRIVESLPTIDKIIDDQGIPILMSHLGRPKGERNEKYSLKPVAEYLSNKFGYNVHFADDCIGESAKKAIESAEQGDIVLLENLRFHKEEEANDPAFSKSLAELGDAYVNDAFGSAHRAHSSTAGITDFISEKYAGKLMLDELEYLGKALNSPIKPFVAIIGGSKISGKIDVIKNLMDKCNTIIIGGGMMFTFYKAKGYNIGKSILEADKVDLAKELISLAHSKGVNLLLPSDVVIADSFSNDATFKTVKAKEIPDEWIGMDIGTESILTFSNAIYDAKIVVWNGPMGVFEMSNFAGGTFAIAKALAEVTDRGAITVVGGGDSVSAIKHMGYSKKVSHVSTGGGASLEFLEGKTLPGVKALE